MAFPTNGILDSFTYSNGALASVSGGAWASPIGLDFNVSSGVIFPIAGSGAIVTYATLGNIGQCEAYITVTQVPGSTEAAGAIWMDTSGNGYGAIYTHGAPGSIAVQKLTGYAGANLGATVSLTLSAGDQIGLWMRPGTNEIEALSATGGTWTSRVTRTDSSYTTDRRIGLAATGTTVGLDSFGGGAVSAGGSTQPPRSMQQYRLRRVV